MSEVKTKYKCEYTKVYGKNKNYPIYYYTECNEYLGEEIYDEFLMFTYCPFCGKLIAISD